MVNFRGGFKQFFKTFKAAVAGLGSSGNAGNITVELNNMHGFMSHN